VYLQKDYSFGPGRQVIRPENLARRSSFSFFKSRREAVDARVAATVSQTSKSTGRGCSNRGFLLRMKIKPASTIGNAYPTTVIMKV
jgi:hypothetical protein